MARVRTVDGEEDGLDVDLESDDGGDALERRLVVLGRRDVVDRRAFAAVDDPPQTAPRPRQTGVVRELEPAHRQHAYHFE